ncbi:hypothetical protein [Virgibacillus chiguensis]|uniref:hypothetical protein n=1 Tax=Virgibacillus chiguensis TaxID=411959 RepID=UPI0009FC22E8|nr:hypothetical protein [Virgibacillus chiguensis]
MKGQLKVRKETPTLYAVPITAGSGSEATLAVVGSNPATFEKVRLMFWNFMMMRFMIHWLNLQIQYSLSTNSHLIKRKRFG